MPFRHPSRRRLLGIGKWAGLVTCIAIAGVWFSTRRMWVEVWIGPFSICADHGAVDLFYVDRDELVGVESDRFEKPQRWWWNWGELRIRGTKPGSPARSVWFLTFPLWALLLLTAAPTGFLWWRGRPCRPPLPRRPLLAIGKWTVLGLCTAIAAVWLVSGWYLLYWVRDWPGGGYIRLIVASGTVALGQGPEDANSPGIGSALAVRTGSEPTWRWSAQPLSSVDMVQIPIWFPFLLAAAATAFLWWRAGRRPKPGHCTCGYNLAGIEDKACPECGRA